MLMSSKMIALSSNKFAQTKLLVQNKNPRVHTELGDFHFIVG